MYGQIKKTKVFAGGFPGLSSHGAVSWSGPACEACTEEFFCPKIFTVLVGSGGAGRPRLCMRKATAARSLFRAAAMSVCCCVRLPADALFRYYEFDAGLFHQFAHLRCYALVGKDTHQLLVYFYTLKAVDRLKHKASGAVFDAITTRDFESEEIMKLSADGAKKFLHIAEPMYQAILSNSIETLRLATLRDALLPKLMSGEIDVSDIQL